MFSSFAIKSGLLDQRDARRAVRRLNRTAKRHRRKWQAHSEPSLIRLAERRMQAHPKEA